VPAATSFVDKMQQYVAEWASAAHEQNVIIEHRLHDSAAWVAYLSGPQQDPAGHDVPGALRPNRRHNGKL
jgi:hypothetical protein